MKKAELVFVPFPGLGHLLPMVEMARLLVDRDDRLSITVLIIKLPFDSEINTYAESLAASSNLSNRIRFITLTDDEKFDTIFDPKNFFVFIENQKPHVEEAVMKLLQPESGTDSPKQLAGFVLDMCCTCMIDVANDFGVPSYVFFTSSAAYLGLMLHLQALHDEQSHLTTELKDSDDELQVPSLINPVPARILPSVLLNNDLVALFHGLSRRYRAVKGIIVNTFRELESHAVSSFTYGKNPPVYSAGPIVNLKGDNYDLGPGGPERKAEIITWLDDQPKSAVVFLCFGSLGSFREDQVKEIASALEQSGHRFLWSIRRPPPKGKLELPGEYTNLVDALPERFLDRTAGIGKVIGWAPQVTVLGHPSIGGFVSHCGWNSTLESMWFGVPIATWPMQGDQQFNAFQLVRELGLAVEIKMDYKNDFTIENPTVVSVEEIENGIRCVMEHDSEIRKRVKEMSKKSRKVMMDGGSSFSSVSCLIDDILDNI